MPKKCTVPHNDLISLFLQNKEHILSEAGVIAGPSAHVWEELSRTLECEVSKKYLYTFVKCNRHDVWLVLGLKDSGDFVDNDSEDECPETQDKCQGDNAEQFEFTITLSPTEWEKIRCQKKTYKCKDSSKPQRNSRDYTVLTPGWTDTINDHFWEHTRLPCSIAFKRAKITPGGGIFLSITGSCTECMSSFQGSLTHEPTSQSRVLINCKFSGEIRNSHSGHSKRRFSGTRRDEAIHFLTKEKISASMYRKMMANDKMRFGDPQPSHIPSVNSLRLAKSRGLEKDRLHSDPISAILQAKYTHPYQETIKDVGLDKFFVQYWSPSQVHVYRSYCDHCEYPKISVDATGSIVRCLQRPFGNKSGHIFLYEVTVHDRPSRQQFSVCNMLSERHDNNSIYHWLAQWLRDGAVIPKEAVCDFSIALLSALVRALTQYNTLEAYLDECSLILYNPEMFSRPKCFIRCDVAHAVKLIASWPPLSNKNHRVRNLYIRSMAQVIQSTSIEDIKALLESIFTVALSPFEGFDETTREVTHCEAAKEKLKRRIATGNSELEDILSKEVGAENTENILDNDNHTNQDCATTFMKWTEKIVESCKQSIARHVGDHDNLQYLPDIVPHILRFCKLLPMWSAVLVPFFGYGGKTASSSPVESSFNDLKNRVLSHKQLPMRVDDFLVTHITSLEGTMKLIAAGSSNTRNSGENQNNETHFQNTQKERTETNLQNSTSVESQANDSPFPNTHTKSRGKFDQTSGESQENESSLPNVHQNGNSFDQNLGKTQDSPLHNAQQPKNSFANNSDTSNEKRATNTSVYSCPACNDGNLPTGAHRCVICRIPVHIFLECSLPVSEEEEGYGQGRICLKCNLGDKQNVPATEKENNSHENWRGLGIPPKKRPRSSYLEANSELLLMNLKMKSILKTIGLLKNGNRATELKPIKIKGTECKLILQNTCSFDSLVQLLACAYCDSKKYFEFVNQLTENRQFWNIVQDIVRVRVSLKLYRQRAQVLAKIFPTTNLPSSLRLLSTESTISNIVNKLLVDNPTVTETASCSKESCQGNRLFETTILSVVTHNERLDDLEGLLSKALSAKNEGCSLFNKNNAHPCIGQKSVLFEISPHHLLLEVYFLPESGPSVSSDSDISPDLNIKLSSIPNTLTVSKKQYTLRGAVGFYGSSNRKSINVIGHYVAFCKRLNQQWEAYNDISDKKKDCVNSDQINCQFLLYTV